MLSTTEKSNLTICSTHDYDKRLHGDSMTYSSSNNTKIHDI